MRDGLRSIASPISIVGLVALLGFAALVSAVCVSVQPPERSGPLPGEPWDGSGDHGLSEADIEAFDRYSVFWLGPEFHGFHLNSIFDTSTGLTFVYGTCTVSGGWFRDGGCPSPVTLHVRPVCAVTPAMAAGVFRATGPSGQDTAWVRYSEGSAMLRTGDAGISVSVLADPSLIEEAVAALKPLGRAAERGLTGSEPPDFRACPQ